MNVVNFGLFLEPLKTYWWFLLITYFSNGSLLFIGYFTKKFVKSYKKFLLTPLELNKKFIDGQYIIGDHKPIVGFFVIIFDSFLFLFIFRQALAFLLPYAVFFGDLIGSFFKRRLRIRNGESLLIVDQLNFFISSYILVLLFNIHFPLQDFILLSVLTFFIHYISNIFAFKIGMKDHPW